MPGWLDIVREGIDCVLRYGQLADSDMIARRVMVMDRRHAPRRHILNALAALRVSTISKVIA